MLDNLKTALAFVCYVILPVAGLILAGIIAVALILTLCLGPFAIIAYAAIEIVKLILNKG